MARQQLCAGMNSSVSLSVSQRRSAECQTHAACTCLPITWMSHTATWERTLNASHACSPSNLGTACAVLMQGNRTVAPAHCNSMSLTVSAARVVITSLELDKAAAGTAEGVLVDVMLVVDGSLVSAAPTPCGLWQWRHSKGWAGFRLARLRPLLAGLTGGGHQFEAIGVRAAGWWLR